jgi:alpha-mannosidase
MRLSLLRSPVDPDPHADEGEHQFTYSLYPHAWDWRAGTVREAYELNEPPLAIPSPVKKGALESVGAFAVVNADNVIIDTVKKAEDSRAVIVRLYEAHGQRGDVSITFDRTPKQASECDLMEENDQPLNLRGNTVMLYVKPFEIRTLKILF